MILFIAIEECNEQYDVRFTVAADNKLTNSELVI